MGLGMGGTMMPIMTSALKTLRSAEVARGSTLLNITQQIASSVGVAVMSVILTNHLQVLACLARDPELRIRDIAGLTDIPAAKHLWRHKADITWETHPFRSHPPKWVAAVYFDGQKLYHADTALTTDLATSYTLAGELPQGPGAAWHFYHLK